MHLQLESSINSCLPTAWEGWETPSPSLATGLTGHQAESQWAQAEPTVKVQNAGAPAGPATLAMAKTLVPSLVLSGGQAKQNMEVHRHVLSARRHWEPTSFWTLSVPIVSAGWWPLTDTCLPAAGTESELPLWSQLFMITWHCLMHCNLASPLHPLRWTLNEKGTLLSLWQYTVATSFYWFWVYHKLLLTWSCLCCPLSAHRFLLVHFPIGPGWFWLRITHLCKDNTGEKEETQKSHLRYSLEATEIVTKDFFCHDLIK